MAENVISISSINRIRTLLKDKAQKILKDYPVLFSYLYGSYARGDAHPFSDIDIGIYLEDIPAQKVLDIELSLALDIDEALGHISNVDARSMTDMPLMMKGNIVTEGILIYSIDEPSRVEFEINIRKAFFDFSPVIKRYHKAYLARISNGA
jgi:predicted nucleotidyltransferase